MINEDLTKALETIGFTHGEAEVYLSLLKIGESSVGPVIKNSKISRSKVYDILERLIQKGVVTRIEKNNVLSYQILSPKRLFSFIQDKEEKLAKEKDILKVALPSLVSMLPERDIDVKLYEGIKGYKIIIERTLNELKKGDDYAMMGISKTTEFMRTYALKIFQKQKEGKFHTRTIFDEQSAKSVSEFISQYHDFRILPAGMKTPAMFTVYSDTVGIYVGEENKLISVVIKNADIAQTFKTIFDVMWSLSKSSKK